jgi:hypothetical protein
LSRSVDQKNVAACAGKSEKLARKPGFAQEHLAIQTHRDNTDGRIATTARRPTRAACNLPSAIARAIGIPFAL